MSDTEYNFKTNDAGIISDTIQGKVTSVDFSMKPVVSRGVVTVDAQSATIGEYDGEEDETEVSYQLDSADTTDSGDYLAEFEATTEDGQTITYPRGRYYFISIEEEV